MNPVKLTLISSALEAAAAATALLFSIEVSLADATPDAIGGRQIARAPLKTASQVALVNSKSARAR